MSWKKTVVILGLIGVILFCFGVFFVFNFVIFPLKHKEKIVEISKKYGVEPYVVASIINAESGFNEKAVSNKGALGLMQLLPSTAKWVSGFLNGENIAIEVEKLDGYNNENPLFNPQINIELGTRYFLYLLNKFENQKVALCAYNAGEGMVQKWLQNKGFSKDGKTLETIPFEETRNYVNKVERGIKIYKKKFN